MKTGMSLRSICNFAYLLNMWANAEKFPNCVELVPDQELEENFTDEKYGNYRRNIEGVIKHSYYHLGQISLLRKMVLESEKGNRNTATNIMEHGSVS